MKGNLEEYQKKTDSLISNAEEMISSLESRKEKEPGTDEISKIKNVLLEIKAISKEVKEESKQWDTEEQKEAHIFVMKNRAILEEMQLRVSPFGIKISKRKRREHHNKLSEGSDGASPLIELNDKIEEEEEEKVECETAAVFKKITDVLKAVLWGVLGISILYMLYVLWN